MMQIDKEYAEALFALSLEEDAVDEYEKNLGDVLIIINENPEYLEYLSSPAVPLEERLGALDDAFGSWLPEYLLSFVKILCENGHIRSLPQCIVEYKNLIMSLSNTSVATVYSVVELSGKQKETLCNKLCGMTGKNISPVFEIDASLIGGLKIEIDGKTYDGSLKRRLQEVKDVITE